jgi:hypothetical protein
MMDDFGCSSGKNADRDDCDLLTKQYKTTPAGHTKVHPQGQTSVTIVGVLAGI